MDSSNANACQAGVSSEAARPGMVAAWPGDENDGEISYATDGKKETAVGDYSPTWTILLAGAGQL